MSRRTLAPPPPPPADSADFNADDLSTCIRVLETLAADRTRLTRLTREERQALLVAAGRVSRPDRESLREMARAFRRKDREEERAHDRGVIGQTGLRVQRQSEVYTPLWLVPPGEEERAETPDLRRERSCYICKRPYAKVHFFYDSMCEECGDFNYEKRARSVPLHGRTALVTGARVKIGYQISLKLLRAGARVLVTTRFPRDAAQRYAREADYAEWSPRLSVYGLDLRHAPSVELFAEHVARTEARLDFLVNNACQTVRRPPQFYQHLLAHETADARDLPESERRVLAAHEELRNGLAGLAAQGEPGTALLARASAPGVGLARSAELSQLRYLDEDFRAGQELFPDNVYDEDLQQRDLRDKNSWRLTLAEVATPELLEVHLVNAVAPFILNGKLKPLMMRERTGDKHVVNVSAMEGQFYRTKKTDRHPHTNMAKAALNMMTRTSAPDYVQAGIHMNAVDTGWVTDEDPAVHAERKAALGFSPPLDIIDGAARVLDPIFSGLVTGQHAWGQFFKDYKPAPW